MLLLHCTLVSLSFLTDTSAAEACLGSIKRTNMDRYHPHHIQDQNVPDGFIRIPRERSRLDHLFVLGLGQRTNEPRKFWESKNCRESSSSAEVLTRQFVKNAMPIAGRKASGNTGLCAACHIFVTGHKWQIWDAWWCHTKEEELRPRRGPPYMYLGTSTCTSRLLLPS